MNTSVSPWVSPINPWVSSINPWVSSLKSSGFDTSSLASTTDPLVEQALTDTLVQAQGIVEEDFSDSPADLMREKAFQDYLAYCRDQRIFDTIEGALGIESEDTAEESEDAEDTLEDSQGISANETASSQQVQALLANFSPSDENADDNLPQDVGYSSDYADLDWEDSDAYEDLSVAEGNEDGDSPDEGAVDWGDDDSDTAGYSSDEDAVDWDDDEDSDDAPGYSSDEDAVDWGDEASDEEVDDDSDAPGYSSDEDNVDWDDDEASDEDNLDWGGDDRPAPRPAPPASLKTAPGGPLAGVGGRNGPAPTPGTYTPQNGSQDAVGRTADMLTSAYDFISASLRSKKG